MRQVVAANMCETKWQKEGMIVQCNWRIWESNTKCWKVFTEHFVEYDAVVKYRDFGNSLMLWYFLKKYNSIKKF